MQVGEVVWICTIVKFILSDSVSLLAALFTHNLNCHDLLTLLSFQFYWLLVSWTFNGFTKMKWEYLKYLTDT